MSDMDSIHSVDRVRQPRTVPDREQERPDRSEDSERARRDRELETERNEEEEREESETETERNRRDEYRGRNVNTFA